MKTLRNDEFFALARETLLEGKKVRIRVQGNSMLPFFRSDTAIVLRPIRTDDIRWGSVVLAETPQGSFVVHRILRIEEDFVTLMGDGNLIGRETVTRDKIYGIVDCGVFHRAKARLWGWLLPVRRYLLPLFR